MILAIAIGIGLTIVSIAVHATGTALLIRRLRRRRIRSGPVDHEAKLNSPGFRRNVWTLSETATLLLLLQLFEVIVWAVAYRFLPDSASPGPMEDCVYFSFVTFTTLGYGDLVLAGSWRLLSAIQAAAGVLICGWSTAILIAVVQGMWSERPPTIR